MKSDYKQLAANKKKEAHGFMTAQQYKQCQIAIHTASVASAAAGAIPVPIADAVPITAAQVAMALRLGTIFNIQVTKTAAEGLVSAAAATLLGRTLFKLIPIVGWGVSAAVAAGVTEAIGWMIAVDFAKSSKEPVQSNSTFAGERTTSERKNDDEFNQLIEGLPKRAGEFFSGQKNVKENKEEYDALIKDFESVLDDLKSDDPIREMYDELSLMF